MRIRSVMTALAAAAMMVAVGCGGYVIVNEPPPPMRAEIIAVSPGPEFIWIEGRWGWERGWVWLPGVWVRPPHHDDIWERGAWMRQDGREERWEWHQGRWRHR